MSEGAGLDWGVLPLGGWEANSKAFKGDYVIEVGHDGLFFVTKRTNIIRPRQCEHVEHIGPDFQTLKLAKSFCEEHENGLLAKKNKASVKIPGCCPLDDETLKKHASTFGPVPASQERVESALDEMGFRQAVARMRQFSDTITAILHRVDKIL